MKIASVFGSYGMQEKMDALNEITLINHRRLKNDNDILRMDITEEDEDNLSALIDKLESQIRKHKSKIYNSLL